MQQELQENTDFNTTYGYQRKGKQLMSILVAVKMKAKFEF